jgi:hypothetical protein
MMQKPIYSKRKRIKLGDIFELPTGKGFAYGQYIYNYNRPPEWGALVRIFEPLFKRRPDNAELLAEESERFLIFFPVGTYVWRGIAGVVAHAVVPLRYASMPTLRSKLKYGDGLGFFGPVIEWRFWNGKNLYDRRSDDLTENEKRTSLKQLADDVGVVNLIESDWRPELCIYDSCGGVQKRLQALEKMRRQAQGKVANQKGA